MPISNVVVRRGSQVQYVPHAFRPQSGPVTSTMEQNSVPTSAPATATASQPSLRLARYMMLPITHRP
jgi:hypothetical protein